jgi:hypothetical protein
MKKLLLIFIVITATKIFSQKIYGLTNKTDYNFISIDFGSIGGGINYSTEKHIKGHFTIDIGDIYYENKITGLGLEIIPINYTYSKIYEDHLMSFLNFNIFWNILEFPLKINKGEYGNIIGPFFSINYLNLINFNSLSFDNVIYTYGLRITLKQGLEYYDTIFGHTRTLLSIEGGYKNINRSHNIFLTIKFGFNYLIGIPIMLIDYKINGPDK